MMSPHPCQLAPTTRQRLAFPMSLCAAATIAAFAPSIGHAQQTAPAAQLPAIIVEGQGIGTLTAPSTAQARETIERTPGGVEVVPDTVWRNTQAATLKDILDYTPGVFVQPKWGEDARLSIRGSGLSRYYHLRGINLYQDGVPLTNADGSSDLQSIDPTAYRYTEVYKGANGLRYGAGTLGGAINFVTPTGRDASPFQARADIGSDGWKRLQLSGGFADDKVDGFITGSTQGQDGFRDHSQGDSQRFSGNLGLRLSEDVETRFYLNGVRIRQEIPGSVTRDQALQNPRKAAMVNELNDWQRNIDGGRLANRTVIQSGDTSYEFGGWLSRTNLSHPIYQFLDNQYADYGTYGRLTQNSTIAGHANRITLGLTWSAGTVKARNYENIVASKGAKLSETRDKSNNVNLYGENAFDIVPGISLITGLQALHTERERTDRFNGGGPAIRSGDKSYDFINPKVGVLWQVDPQWQVFGNLSRSAEAPTFGDMNFSTANDLDRLKPQRATTLEVGTRGTRQDYGWDLSVYHARIRNEFQCVSTPYDICGQTTNLNNSVHQGVEAGFDWTFLRNVLPGTGTGDSLIFKSAYTFSDFRFRHDPSWGDKRIPGVPRHYLRAEVLYKHPSGFYAGPNVEWVPQAYFVDNANSVKTASYALLGLRAGWEQGRYSVFIEGRNLADKRYIASASITDRANAASALFEPGSGRTVFAGLQIKY